MCTSKKQEGVKETPTEPTKEKKELIIDGRYYDVTNMKHPGGSVINYYAGTKMDATDAFHEFHVRSYRAKKMLESLPSRPIDKEQRKKEMLPNQQALLDDFKELTEQLKKEGFFDAVPSHYLYRIFEVVFALGLGLYLINQGYFIAGVLIVGVFHGRCAGLCHEAGHYSLTCNLKMDKFLEEFFFALGNGESASWWRIQHNKHHATPQKLGYDVDLNTLPLVAFTEKVAKEKLGMTTKWWLRFQAFLFPAVIANTVTLMWQYYLHPRHIIRTRNYQEVPWLILRHVIWTMCVTTKYGLYKSAFLYIATQWVFSNFIFNQFAMSHTHLGTVPQDDETMDWVRFCSLYSMNVESGMFNWVDWWMVNLNFQIEHHLYPSIPQFRHNEISPRVQALFKKHGLPYKRQHYFQALYTTYKHLDHVGHDIFLG